jgi:hypothetical protein
MLRGCGKTNLMNTPVQQRRQTLEYVARLRENQPDNHAYAAKTTD